MLVYQRVFWISYTPILWSQSYLISMTSRLIDKFKVYYTASQSNSVIYLCCTMLYICIECMYSRNVGCGIGIWFIHTHSNFFSGATTILCFISWWGPSCKIVWASIRHRWFLAHVLPAHLENGLVIIGTSSSSETMHLPENSMGLL